ncbi:MAG: hypothetical protein ACTS6J_02060 [Burkholderiales bacterium]
MGKQLGGKMFGLGRKLDAMEISAAAFDEIAAKLGAFLPGHVDERGWIDMKNIRLARGDDPEPLPRHRPISKNTAPGAI